MKWSTDLPGSSCTEQVAGAAPWGPRRSPRSRSRPSRSCAPGARCARRGAAADRPVGPDRTGYVRIAAHGWREARVLGVVPVTYGWSWRSARTAATPCGCAAVGGPVLDPQSVPPGPQGHGGAAADRLRCPGGSTRPHGTVWGRGRGELDRAVVIGPGARRTVEAASTAMPMPMQAAGRGHGSLRPA